MGSLVETLLSVESSPLLHLFSLPLLLEQALLGPAVEMSPVVATTYHNNK